MNPTTLAQSLSQRHRHATPLAIIPTDEISDPSRKPSDTPDQEETVPSVHAYKLDVVLPSIRSSITRADEQPMSIARILNPASPDSNNIIGDGHMVVDISSPPDDGTVTHGASPSRGYIELNVLAGQPMPARYARKLSIWHTISKDQDAGGSLLLPGDKKRKRKPSPDNKRAEQGGSDGPSFRPLFGGLTPIAPLGRGRAGGLPRSQPHIRKQRSLENPTPMPSQIQQARGPTPRESYRATKSSSTCSECGRVFSRYFDVLRHRRSSKCSRTDTEPTQHACVKCDKTYARLDGLRRHAKNCRPQPTTKIKVPQLAPSSPLTPYLVRWFPVSLHQPTPSALPPSTLL